jgi:phosphate acyltransferase
MRIAVDVMGGDFGCDVVIDGVKLALHNNSRITNVHLVGQRDQIEAALARTRFDDGRIHITHASEVLTMDDRPVAAVPTEKRLLHHPGGGSREDRQSRSHDFARKHRWYPGRIHAQIGHSAWCRALGIATVIPAPENEFVLLDSGANIDCKPIHLVQYAIMGHVYSRDILGYARNHASAFSASAPRPSKATS